MCPLNRRLICVVGELKGCLDYVVRILESGLPEAIRSFDNGGSDDVKPRLA